MRSSNLLQVALLSFALTITASDQFDSQSYLADHIITRDVVIIGGGSSGTYAAVNLRRLGKSVVVVEKDATLGGHTNSYTDPSTGKSVDYGVLAYWNISVAHDYVSSLNVSVSPYQVLPNKPFYANFKTGKQVGGVQSTYNFTSYAEQLPKYPYLGYSWDLPNPVPDDLLLPFGEFIKKYNLGDEAFDIYSSTPGISNYLGELTVNVIKSFDESYLQTISGKSLVGSSSNGEIYTKATTVLGNDVLFSSTVVATKRPARSGDGVVLVVRTPTGLKLIRASKLLITIPPLLSTMQPFDLDDTERSLFSQWKYTNYYTMLVSSTGLPSGFNYVNADESASTYHIPTLPAAYSVTATRIPGLFYVWYGSPVQVSEGQVKADVITAIERLRHTTNSTATADPHFVEFKSHTPFKLVVSADAIRERFYDRLEGLQGQRDTWWTGAAFIAHDSSVLWNFTNALLPRIVEG